MLIFETLNDVERFCVYVKVESAIQRARRSSAVEGIEAVAVMELLQYAEHLQSNLKGAIKEDAEWYRRFIPLSEVVSVSLRVELCANGNWVLTLCVLSGFKCDSIVCADNGICGKPITS